MSKIRDVFNKFKQAFSKPKEKQKITHSGTNYKPLKLVSFDPITAKRKHPLHKFHFGTFSPIKKYK